MRPERSTITNVSGWDVPAEGNFAKTFDTPFPPAMYDNFGSLPTAASFEGCVAYLEDEDLLVVSKGGIWKRLGHQCAYQIDSVATGVTDLRNDFNALLAKLQSAALMATS